MMTGWKNPDGWKDRWTDSQTTPKQYPPIFLRKVGDNKTIFDNKMLKYLTTFYSTGTAKAIKVI